MGQLVELDGRSVGRSGENRPQDVVRIAAALTAIGPDRGGVFAPPLSIDGLAQAIESFQKFQKLAFRDGRVDRGGSTLRRINEVLGNSTPPGPAPAPAPDAQSGELVEIAAPDGMPTAVRRVVWAPVEQSIASQMVFEWSGVAGSGTIRYFELREQVVPNVFGVLVPAGLSDLRHVHIFFHPTPAQAGFDDRRYFTKNGGWGRIFHYLSDDMGVQFCGAGTSQVLVMPLMTQGAASTCGVFPARWESIVGRMLGIIASPTGAADAPPVPISTVTVSSFSSGITYSAAFRQRAGLAGRLLGAIDLDGIISSYRRFSEALGTSLGRPAIRMWQTAASQRTLATSAAHGLFPLPQPRWGGPYAMLSKPPFGVLNIHGAIPQTMMYVAARRVRP